MGAWCQLWTVYSTRPVFWARRVSDARSARAPTSGFSQSTCSPRSSALRMSGAWLEGGVQMSTKSSEVSDRSSGAVGYQRAPGAWATRTVRCSGRASVPPTISTSRRRRQPGRWPWRATLPRPMSAPRILLEPVLSDDHPERLVENREPRERGILADRERRVEADRRRVGHGDETPAQTFLVERLRHRLGERRLGRPVAHELDSEHEALTAHVTNAAVLFLQLLEAAEHHLAHSLGVLDEILLQDDLERGEAGRGGQRVAAIARRAGARVGPGLRGRGLLAGDHAGQRKAAAHPLADRHDVGHDPVVLGAPHGAGTAEPGDHLVGDQERAMLARDSLHSTQEAVRGNDVAGGALHRLDDDRADLARRLIPDDVAHELRARDAAVRIAELQRTSIAVGVGREVATGRERAEMMLELAAEQRQHAGRLAVEAAPEPEHLGLAGGGVGEPQRGLDRLGATGEHLDAREPFRSHGSDQVEELRARLGREAAERQPLDLALERFDVVGMTVAHAADGDAGDEVDVLVAVLVDQRAVDTARHREAGVEGKALGARRQMTALLGDDLLRARSDFTTLSQRRPPENRRAR